MKKGSEGPQGSKALLSDKKMQRRTSPRTVTPDPGRSSLPATTPSHAISLSARTTRSYADVVAQQSSKEPQSSSFYKRRSPNSEDSDSSDLSPPTAPQKSSGSSDESGEEKKMKKGSHIPQGSKDGALSYEGVQTRSSTGALNIRKSLLQGKPSPGTSSSAGSHKASGGSLAISEEPQPSSSNKKRTSTFEDSAGASRSSPPKQSKPSIDDSSQQKKPQLNIHNVEAIDVVHHLDLHGLHSDKVQDEFKKFLNDHHKKYIASGESIESPITNFVQIITGRGKHSPTSTSVLKQIVDTLLESYCENFKWDAPGGSVIVDVSSYKMQETTYNLSATTYPREGGAKRGKGKKRDRKK